MAKIISESITISFSTLVRNDEEDVAQLINEKTEETIDAAMQELFGDLPGVVVEITKDE